MGAGEVRVRRARPPEHPPRPPIPIVPLDDAACAAARDHARGLGRLDDLAVWLAGVSGDGRPRVRARVVVVAGALDDRLAVAALAREAGAELVLAGTGVAGAREPATEPALTSGEVALAVDTGRDLAARAARDGITVVAGGAPGSAATTSATCLAAALTGHDSAAVTGPGADRAAVARALALHGPELGAPAGPLRALRRLGCGEIAVLCGLALGAGEHGLGYVCDGLATTAAAAVAVAVEPALRPRLLAAHRSPEPAHAALLDHLGLEPVLDLGLRTGDGSGAVAAIALLRLACAARDS